MSPPPLLRVLAQCQTLLRLGAGMIGSYDLVVAA